MVPARQIGQHPARRFRDHSPTTCLHVALQTQRLRWRQEKETVLGSENRERFVRLFKELARIKSIGILVIEDWAMAPLTKPKPELSGGIQGD